MTSGLTAILDRPRAVVSMMIFMVLAGIAAYVAIAKEANPDIDIPVYYVSVGQQGISPDDAERLLVRPMETQLRGMEGLKELTAIASQGHAGLVAEFQMGTDKDKVLADLRDKVDQAKAKLPEDADEPSIFETNVALEPTMVVTLSGDVPERELFRKARQLKDELESISSVREANMKGNREELLEVQLDLMRLNSYNITQSELIAALSQYNRLVPAGFIDDGNARFNLKVPGLVESASDVYEIPIKQNGEGVVTLGDIASIRRTFKDPTSFTRVNGKPAISIEVIKRIGTNIIQNNIEVRRVAKEFTQNWPSAIKVGYMLDESSFIFEVLGSLESSIMTAIMLVMIVVIGSLGFRSGLLVGLAIPTSFLVGFLILSLFGMTVNMMVMFGMVLTVGMLVDGAIVMIEYADRKLAEGLPPEQAYSRAAELMFWPIISSTATTLAAFLPLLMWPGVVGEFMSYLPIMVIIVLSASLLTALVFVPVTGVIMANSGNLLSRYSSLFSSAFGGLLGLFMGYSLGRDMFGTDASSLVLFLCAIAGAVVIALAFFVIGSWAAKRRRDSHDAEKEEKKRKMAHMLSAHASMEPHELPGILGVYVRALDVLTRSLVGNLVSIIAIAGFTIGSFFVFAAHPTGVEFFVDEEPDKALVFVSARGNMSGREILSMSRRVEDQLLQIEGIDNMVMTATVPGSGGSGGRINPGAPQDTPPDMVTAFQLELADFDRRRSAKEIFSEVRERVGSIAGIKAEVREIQGGPPTGKDVRLQVKSNNYEDVVGTVGRLRQYFDADNQLQDIEDGRPLPGIEWEMTVDREMAGRYQAGIDAIGALVQLVSNGVLIGTYRPDDSEDEIDIRVRLPESQRSLEELNALRLTTPKGQVPMENFVKLEPKPVLASITRRDGQFAMDIKANIIPGTRIDGRDMGADDKVAQIQKWLDGQQWPESVSLKFRGADEDQKDSQAFLGKAALGALFLMFMILLTQYNSFYQTVLTLSTVVMAMVGVLLGMMITGQKFSVIMTGTGIVALAGIVVNNAIVLIDTYNRLRHEGVPIHQSVLKTSAQRMRPIMLTTITTIMGLVPMALSVNFDFFNRVINMGSITSIWWVQLSTAVISGLAFSTLLTLVAIPVMLSLPDNIARTASNIMNRKGIWAKITPAWWGRATKPVVDEPNVQKEPV